MHAGVQTECMPYRQTLLVSLYRAAPSVNMLAACIANVGALHIVTQTATHHSLQHKHLAMRISCKHGITEVQPLSMMPVQL